MEYPDALLIEMYPRMIVVPQSSFDNNDHLHQVKTLLI